MVNAMNYVDFQDTDFVGLFTDSVLFISITHRLINDFIVFSYTMFFALVTFSCCLCNNYTFNCLCEIYSVN